MPAQSPTIAVVGGGLAGLAAALELATLRPDLSVVVLEGAARLGGKVRVSEVAGLPVDEGADSMLLRLPYGVELAADAGLAADVVHPAAGSAYLWSRGRLRPLPTGTVLGIPADLAALARSEALSPAGLLRVPLDLVLPGDPPREDVAVGALVRRRLGAEVVDRLVDPLLGGVYAGRADLLSLHATLPQLAGPASRSRSLLLAAQAVRGSAPAARGSAPAARGSAQAVRGSAPAARAPAPAPAGPVFAGLVGGLGRLPDAVAAASGADVRRSTTVRALHRTAAGWRLETGSAAHPAHLDVAGVVLAVPAAPAARLLAPHLPAAAAELGSLDYASVAIVTLALAGPAPGAGSGYLVPAGEGRVTKAVTFTSRKWASYPGGVAVVRASVGRYGEEADLQRGDGELVGVVLRELVAAVGPVGPLVDSRVVRWGGALPQYAVGHLDRVARLRAAVAGLPGLAVAGAAYDGVGVPAVVRSGRQAAQAVIAGLPHDGLPHNGGHDLDSRTAHARPA